MFNKILIAFIFSYFVVSAEKPDENNQFIATKEWQVVKEGMFNSSINYTDIFHYD